MPIRTSVPEITSVDEPLLSPPHATVSSPSAVDRPSSRVPMLLGLFAGRRGASLIVSQNVALQMEYYREAWGYSLPVVVIETLWNLAFVVVSLATVFWIAREEKNARLRVWICGYEMQCVVDVAVLLMEYKKRNRRVLADPNSTVPGFSTSSGSSSENNGDRVTPPIRWDMIYTMVSYLWWVLGFIWMLSYNNSATPCLFWLTLAFLAMDVFFLVLRSLFFCLLSAAYCFCLPCILAFMHYISQENASDADISILPKYRVELFPDECRLVPMGGNGQDFSTQLVILTEYAECCICLCRYEDGEQLHLLLCGHHFHSTCIVKWLRLKATCPVCKSLVPSNEQG